MQSSVITSLTPLNTLLRDLEIEPQFILYFTRRIDAQKTTTAKLYLNFFGRFDVNLPTSFKDTPNATEMGVSLTDSALVVADGRILRTTPDIKAQMKSIGQNIIRMIGDRSGRGCMTSYRSLANTYRLKCNALVMVEESFLNIGENAVARAISVEMKPRM